MTKKDIEFFERVNAQLQQFQNEFSILSKSKPDNPVSKFKLTFINEKLADANSILIGRFKPLKEFTLFDDGSLPTNSDVVIVLSQYLEGLEGWRCANIKREGFSWYWNISDAQIGTAAPTRFQDRSSDK